MIEAFPCVRMAVGALRETCPRDFPTSLPIYTLAFSEVGGESNPPDCAFVAFTGQMPPALRERLMRAGEWRGNGFWTVFNDAFLAGDRRGFSYALGVLVHEAGHYLASKSSPFQNTASLARLRTACRMNPRLEDYHCAESPRSRHHAAPWIRGTLHLWHRMQCAYPAALSDCLAPWELYGHSPLQLYFAALAPELWARRDDPITHILKTPPIDEFAMLWQQDMLRARRQ